MAIAAASPRSAARDALLGAQPLPLGDPHSDDGPVPAPVFTIVPAALDDLCATCHGAPRPYTSLPVAATFPLVAADAAEPGPATGAGDAEAMVEIDLAAAQRLVFLDAGEGYVAVAPWGHPSLLLTLPDDAALRFEEHTAVTAFTLKMAAAAADDRGALRRAAPAVPPASCFELTLLDNGHCSIAPRLRPGLVVEALLDEDPAPLVAVPEPDASNFSEFLLRRSAPPPPYRCPPPPPRQMVRVRPTMRTGPLRPLHRDPAVGGSVSPPPRRALRSPLPDPGRPLGHGGSPSARRPPTNQASPREGHAETRRPGTTPGITPVPSRSTSGELQSTGTEPDTPSLPFARTPDAEPDDTGLTREMSATQLPDRAAVRVPDDDDDDELVSAGGATRPEQSSIPRFDTTAGPDALHAFAAAVAARDVAPLETLPAPAVTVPSLREEYESAQAALRRRRQLNVDEATVSDTTRRYLMIDDDVMARAVVAHEQAAEEGRAAALRAVCGSAEDLDLFRLSPAAAPGLVFSAVAFSALDNSATSQLEDAAVHLLLRPLDADDDGQAFVFCDASDGYAGVVPWSSPNKTLAVPPGGRDGAATELEPVLVAPTAAQDPRQAFEVIALGDGTFSLSPQAHPTHVLEAQLGADPDAITVHLVPRAVASPYCAFVARPYDDEAEPLSTTAREAMEAREDAVACLVGDPEDMDMFEAAPVAAPALRVRPGSRCDPGAPVVLRPRTFGDGDDNCYVFTAAGAGYVCIVPWTAPDCCLAVGEDVADCLRIQATAPGDPAQEFELCPVGAGVCTMAPRLHPDWVVEAHVDESHGRLHLARRPVVSNLCEFRLLLRDDLCSDDDDEANFPAVGTVDLAPLRDRHATAGADARIVASTSVRDDTGHEHDTPAGRSASLLEPEPSPPLAGAVVGLGDATPPSRSKTNPGVHHGPTPPPTPPQSPPLSFQRGSPGRRPAEKPPLVPRVALAAPTGDVTVPATAAHDPRLWRTLAAAGVSPLQGRLEEDGLALTPLPFQLFPGGLALGAPIARGSAHDVMLCGARGATAAARVPRLPPAATLAARGLALERGMDPHPGVLRPLAVEVATGTVVYPASPWCDLGRVVAHGSLSHSAAVSVVARVAAALKAMHTSGVAHGGVRASSVLLFPAAMFALAPPELPLPDPDPVGSAARALEADPASAVPMLYGTAEGRCATAGDDDGDPVSVLLARFPATPVFEEAAARDAWGLGVLALECLGATAVQAVLDGEPVVAPGEDPSTGRLVALARACVSERRASVSSAATLLR